ncbi:Alcohol acetyltransferase [Aspergillus melleus]|uniref:Alcohol acetyltransferase n=1 Tax=Aspergillus melleus TaxID=138277 RepID=A0ACC3AVR7_9EURO|nr:Alcohol acetyltransferase [Aspergillus melleus]
MAGTEQLEKLRPVGGLEQYATARHHLRFFYNAGVTADYTLPSTYALPAKEYIYKACETLIAQHPILSAIPVAEETKEPYFVRLPQIDLNGSVSFHERAVGFPDAEDAQDEDLEALLKIQHNRGFEPPLPYWRLCVLTHEKDERRFTAAFIFHHALSDGESGKAFHRTFLRALQGLETLGIRDGTTGIVKTPEMPLLPTLEQAHPLPLSWWFIATTLFKAKVWSPARNPGLWTGGRIASSLETDVRHFAVSGASSSAFRDVCRKNGTTVTGALQTIVARSLFKHLPDSYTQLDCACNVSTRRWHMGVITMDSIGDWVNGFNETLDRANLTLPSFPWEEARRARETIEGVLNLQGRDMAPALLKYVDDFKEELFLSKVGRERDSSFEISNIGAVGLKEAQDSAMPRMGRMTFSQSANVTGSAIAVSSVTGADGCLVLTFVWQKGVVDEDLMSSLIPTVKADLLSLCVE